MSADLEINIYRRDSDSYTVELRSSVQEETTDQRSVSGEKVRLPIDQLRALGAQPEQYGTVLWDALLADRRIRDRYAAAVARALSRKQASDEPALRVRLNISPTVPELHSLRWESLFDSTNGRWLASDQRVVLSRYAISDDERPVRTAPADPGRMKVVLAVANPSDLGAFQPGGRPLPPVDVAGEVSRARAALAGIDTAGVVELSGNLALRPTLGNLLAELRKGCELLYLVCHGAITDESYLWLEDDTGGAAVVAGSKLLSGFRELPELPRLVVLASCQGAGRGTDARATDGGALATLGPGLVEGGVPAVLAMQGDVFMATVAAFMPPFFSELLRTGVIDQAAASARTAARNADRPDWWAPVLFHRLRDGRLWGQPARDSGFFQHHTSLKKYDIDFDAEKKTAERFVGRKDLFRRLDAFAGHRPCGYFRVVADAGLGKTALAAKVADEKKAPVFFANASRGRTRPDQCLNYLSAVLIARCRLAHDRLPARAGESSDFLGKILAEAAAKSDAPLWIVVDALDEAAAPGPGQNPLLLPDRLPRGVFMLLTHRPGQVALVTAPGTANEEYRIDQNDAAQQADIEAYLRQEADRPEIRRAIEAAIPPSSLSRFVAFLRGQSKVDRFVGILEARSQGNFKYLEYVLDDIAAHQPGSGPLNLDVLPRGLMEYYQTIWKQMEPDPRTRKGWADWNGLFRPTIAFLAAVREPVSAAWLAAQIGQPMEEVSGRALRLWGRYLSREDDGDSEHWRVVHQSFADFTATKVDLRGVHDRIASFYLSAWAGLDAGLPALFDPARREELDDYGLRHLAGHLERAGRIDDLHRLLRLERPAGGYESGPVHVENAWYAAHERVGQTEMYMNDLASAARLVRVTDRPGVEPSQDEMRLGLGIRYALMGTSLNSLARNIPPTLLTALIEKRVWSVSQGLAYARVSPPEVRVHALIAICPYLNDQDGKTLLREALNAARGIEGDNARARAIADLAPRLADPGQASEALAIARGIKADEARASALAALGRIEEALKAVAGIEEMYRDRALEALAPRLADPSQVEEALVIARKVQFTSLSDGPVAALVPRLAALGREEEALAIARGIGTVWERAKALAALDRVEEALEVARGGEGIPSKLALHALVPQLANPDHVAAALGMAQEIEDKERTPVLRDLAARLAELGQVTEALAIARGFSDQLQLSYVLAALAPHLTDLDEVEAALALARRVENEWDRATSLAALVPRLADLGRLGVALTLVQEIRDEGHRASAVEALAPRLTDAKQVNEVLLVVRRIGDLAHRVLAIAALTDRPTDLVSFEAAQALTRAWEEETFSFAMMGAFPPGTDMERVQEEFMQARRLGNEANRLFKALMAHPTDLESVDHARALVGAWEMKREARFASLAAFAPQSLQAGEVEDAITTVRGIAENVGRDLALVALAPRLVDSDQVGEALALAREIQDGGSRAFALGTLVLRLLELGQLEDALAVAREIPKEGEWIRAIDFAALASSLAAPRARAPEVWGEILRLPTARSRRDLLIDLTSLAPAVTAVGGPEAIDEALRAIEDVGRWWP